MRMEKNHLEQDEDMAFVKLQYVYYFYYWSVTFLCWLVIPIVQYYQESGYLVWWRKLKYSVVENLKFYVVVGIIAGILIALLRYVGLMRQYGLIQFLRSMANCWGLFEIMVLFGYSSVQVPRAHWRTAQLKLQMAYLYFKAEQIKLEQDESEQKLLSYSKQILIIREIEKKNQDRDSYSQEIHDYCENIVNLLPKDILVILQQQIKEEELTNENLYQKTYNIDDVAILRTKIKMYLREVKRSKNKWTSHLKSAFWLQDVILNEKNPNQAIESSLRDPRTGKHAKLINQIEWLWNCYWRPIFKYFWAIILTSMSITLLVSEASLYSIKEISVLGNIVTESLSKYGSDVARIQIITLIPLLYMIFNAYYGYFRLKISGMYGLYSNHQTDAPSLLFTCQNFSRIACPLCFNYLEMIRMKDCAFNTVLGEINLVPVLGQKIANLYPCLIIIFFIFYYFDFYGKILILLGLQKYQFTDDYDHEMIEPGTQLVLEARKEKECEKEKKYKMEQLQNIERSSLNEQLIYENNY